MSDVDVDNADVYRLEDNGVSVEVFCGSTGRKLLLVTPDDSSRLYFAARHKAANQRYAGVVANITGVGKLMHWLDGADFNDDGLVVSRRDATKQCNHYNARLRAVCDDCSAVIPPADVSLDSHSKESK